MFHNKQTQKQEDGRNLSRLIEKTERRRNRKNLTSSSLHAITCLTMSLQVLSHDSYESAGLKLATQCLDISKILLNDYAA